MKFPSDEEIRIFKDGDSWCATRLSFINLQESLSGFGDNVLACAERNNIGKG